MLSSYFEIFFLEIQYCTDALHVYSTYIYIPTVGAGVLYYQLRVNLRQLENLGIDRRRVDRAVYRTVRQISLSPLLIIILMLYVRIRGCR